MKVTSCLSSMLATAAFLLTVMFIAFKIGGVGHAASWEWYQVLSPAEFYVLWMIFWIIVGVVKEIAGNHTPRSIRDPHHTFEPLRRFRAWRWEKSQKKYKQEES